MISLSAPAFDLQGTVIFRERPRNPWQGQRRGSVTATLDGGVAVYDTGYSFADQTFTAQIKRPSRTVLTTLQYLVAYYGEVIACCETGAYSALLSFALNNELLTLTLRPTRRLDT